MQKIILLLFVVATSVCYGQNSITGTVLDEQTQQPLIGATIYIPELEKGTITDFNGNFSFKNLQNDSYRFIISSLGYATNTMTSHLPLEENLEIFLSPSIIEMEEVIVSTPFHQLQSENVMPVEHASLEELSKSGAVNLSEGITQIAGVENISTGTGIGKPVIRGLRSNRVLVYTQGIRLENQQFGGEHGLGVNSSGIESVEVIKGPVSLLYGSDALGGVLYLNPEGYAPTDSTQIDAKTTYYKNTLGLEGNLGFKTSSEKLKFLIRSSYVEHSDYRTGADNRVTNTRFKDFDLKSGLGFRTMRYTGDLRYNFNNSRLGIPEGIGIRSTSKRVLEPYQKIKNHILSLDNTFYLKNSSFDLKLGYTFNNRKEFEDHDEHEEGHEEKHQEEHEEEPDHEIHGEAAALVMHLETLNYDAKYYLPLLGNFETIVGVQGMYQTNMNLGEEILIPDAFTADFGILATTHYHHNLMDIQAGLRYDSRSIKSESSPVPWDEHSIPEIDQNFNSYNGALGVKFDLTPFITSRINLATGFRAPNLAELTSNGSHHGSNRYEVGNPDLENEQNYQLDVALEYTNQHFEAFANAFYNRINNYIYLDPTGEIIDDNPAFEYVQDNANLYGGEAGFQLHPHPLDWLHIESSYELVIGKQENGDYLPLMPAQSILNTLRIEFPEAQGLQESYSFITVKSTFEQNNVSEFETPTPGYTLLSAGLGGSFDLDDSTLKVQLSGRNLLDKNYFSHLSRLKPDGIYDIGRNITMSIKFIL